MLFVVVIFRQLGELATGVILLTSDKTLLPAVLLEEPLKKFDKNPALLNDEQYFLAYPSWDKESPHLRLELFRLRLASNKKRKSRRGRDLFDIRGYVTKVQKRKRLITVRVYRNEAIAQNPLTRSDKQLEIIVSLSASAVKQLWDAGGEKETRFLVVRNCHGYQLTLWSDRE